MRPCFNFTPAAKADQSARLSIYDEIGFWGVQAKDFIRDLQAVESKALTVEINSPGGDVFAGLAIYNALKGSGKEINVHVMGVAASAASLIAMAGDTITMPKNTFMMVHNPWSFAMGTADDLRDSADTLDKIGASLQATYVARTGQTEDKVKEMLSKDTWMTADEALELGFATEVVEDVKANASFDMARADLPERVRAVFASATKPTPDPAPTPEPQLPDSPAASQIAAAAQAAGLSEKMGIHLALHHETVADAQARIGQARDILALCTLVGQPDAALGHVCAGTAPADVRKALAEAAAKADENTVVNTTPPQKTQGQSGAPSGPSNKSRWDKHAKASNPAARGNK